MVAAYLANLRVMQAEEPDMPITPAMMPARHAATMASVAAKARDLLSELAAARLTVKPRKAPKNKAAEMSARLAAAASKDAAAAADEAGVDGRLASFVRLDVDAEDGASVCGSDNNDDHDCSSWSGHQDTSRESSSPRTTREDEERLLYALQGPQAAEDTLRRTRVSGRAPGAHTHVVAGLHAVGSASMLRAAGCCGRERG